MHMLAGSEVPVVVPALGRAVLASPPAAAAAGVVAAAAASAFAAAAVAPPGHSAYEAEGL